MIKKEHETIPGLTLRYTELSDAKYLKEWLMDPAVGRWFPMTEELEVEDSVNRWIGFSRFKCSITAVMNDVPCGLSTLYLHPYRRLAHQCEFGIIVSSHFHNMGIGTFLLTNIMSLAKQDFQIKLMHLQVYSENPAIRLYKRFGFREFGRQNTWSKESDNVYSGRVFMERLL